MTTYTYDGTLAGFYCCVHESVYAREMPYAIAPADTAEPSLFEQKHIPTDTERARRVRTSVSKKISPRALTLTETVFLSCLAQKELKLLRFLLLGYRVGAKTDTLISHPDVNALCKAEQHLLREAHLLLGFIRFTDYGGVLAAGITPKNFILPFIADHFCDRYSQENLFIYDKTHHAALIYHEGARRIENACDVRFAQASEAELQYQALWKRFYDAIAIEGRTNPRCKMTHMPKRYWDNMVEFQLPYND